MSELFPLTVRGASSRRRGKMLVGPVDLDLDGRGTVAVIGPNGAGKTSLLRLLHGIARLHSGQITWACDQMDAFDAQAFVFQRPVMLRRSVGENLMYPLRVRKMARDAALRAAQAQADRFGLTEHFDTAATSLSGGEQQKLAIARAMIGAPKLLFLDEPTASLDGRATREIEDLLKDVTTEGTRLILSTHDMGQAQRMADHVIFMVGGQVHEQSEADPFFAQPSTPKARAFLKGDIIE